MGSLGAVLAGQSLLTQNASAADENVLGAAGVKSAERSKKGWRPVSDRKIRVGLVGHGRCEFGVAFGFQDHPNVSVVAVSDLIPERCQAMSQACRCEKTYPSLEEMVKDDSIEAIYVATDAPHHAQHCIEVLNHGKHVATAVPAFFGTMDDAEKLLEAVKKSGLKYMMFETTAYHEDCHAMREIYKAGGFGKLIYSEGEYFHHMNKPLPSFKGWRIGLPPQWYPTHATGYYVCVTGGSFTEVSCMGIPSIIEQFQPENNQYKNPFATEVALLRTSEGGMARIVMSWDSHEPGEELGRIRGQRGTMWNGGYQGEEKNLPDISVPALPPQVQPGGHGGSHGQLMNEFVTAILENRQPLVDIKMALNLTAPGVIAHQSALKNGELMKVPQV
jgi:predicted dehydrogenase